MNAVGGAAALLVLLGAGACTLTGPVAPPGAGVRAALLVRADLSGTAATTVVVEIAAPDIPTPLVFNLAVQGGVASGTVTAPTGSGRTITVMAFDSAGVETDSGSVIVAIRPGGNPTVSITMTPLVGSVPIQVTVGSFAVAISPAVEPLIVGDTAIVTATVLDAQGTPVSGQVVWGTLAPGVATVVSTGQQSARVTGVAAGQGTIVATFGGTAGAAAVVVTVPPSGAWTHEPAGLGGLAEQTGDRDYDFVAQDVYGTYPASGWFNPYLADSVTGQLTLVTDSSAPFPTHVVQMMYPIGFSGGVAPGTLERDFTPATEYYLAFYFKISNPYQSVDGGHNKIAYIYTPTRDLVLEFFPKGNNWIFSMAEYVSDTTVEVDHLGAYTVLGGGWYKVEISMSYSNSRVRWWINGRLDQDFHCNFTAHAGGGLSKIQLSPTYGGGGLPVKTEVDYLWYDHVHMSGLP